MPLPCPQCGRRQGTARALQRHLVLCQQLLGCSCGQRAFTSERALKTHLRATGHAPAVLTLELLQRAEAAAGAAARATRATADGGNSAGQSLGDVGARQKADAATETDITATATTARATTTTLNAEVSSALLPPPLQQLSVLIPPPAHAVTVAEAAAGDDVPMAPLEHMLRGPWRTHASSQTAWAPATAAVHAATETVGSQTPEDAAWQQGGGAGAGTAGAMPLEAAVAGGAMAAAYAAPSAETQTPPSWLREVLGESLVVDTACQASMDHDDGWHWVLQDDPPPVNRSVPHMLDATVDTEGLGPTLTASEGCQAGSPLNG